MCVEHPKTILSFLEASVSLDNMNNALKILQSQIPGLTISFTLMVQGDDYGITDELGVKALQSAAKLGVVVDIVNPMAMEFGSKSTSWGDAVINAAESTHRQMKLVWPSKSDSELYAMLGVTPMIGRNFNGKIFQIEHAKQLVAWAKTKRIGHLSFWSLGRDNGKCSGGGISPDCSSIAQADFEFTKIFQEYASTKIPDHSDEPTSTTKAAANPTTSSQTTTPTPTSASTKGTPVKVDCSTGKEYFAHESDCNSYYWCFNHVAHLEHCGAGTVWDPKINACNYPQDAHRTDCH